MRSTTMRVEGRHLWLGAGLLGAGLALYLSLDARAEMPAERPAERVAAAQPEAPLAQLQELPSVEATAPAPDLSQLRLHGLLATGAIIGTASGQHLVRLGREVMPGVTLQEVRQQHAVLATETGRFELGFMGVSQGEEATGSAALASAGPGMTPAQAQRSAALQYRFGLESRREEGRTTGYAVRPGAEMPLLQRAGLRTGDVLIAVNGQTFDSDEKVMELAGEIAGSYNAEFEFLRNGRRMKATLPVNPRS
ncbi:MAG: type II secretion system protein N [Allosphingosinicella sp.]